MSDVADILGFAKKEVLSTSDEALRIFSEKGKIVNGKGIKKPKGMSREVFDLVGSETLVPAMQPNNIGSGFKNKRSTAMKGKWIWDVIKSSAREDQSLELYHWVKADMHYADYPYAKFNTKLDPLVFSLEEYEQYGLSSPEWSYDDTVTVVNVSIRYDLRWPVVYDRLALSVPKKMEEIQSRYFNVTYTLLQARNESENPINKPSFNMELEMNRRQQQDILFRKTKGDEAEECRLREELKSIDLALKKYKKQVKATAAAAAATVAATAASAKAAAKAAGIEAALEAAAVPTIIVGSTLNPAQVPAMPHPVSGKPCLQSTRLYTTDMGAGISKNLFRKMNSYLTEAGLPERPMPSRAVCDLVDQIRLDTVTLLSLHNAISRKEKPPGHSGGAVSSTIVKTEKISKAKEKENKTTPDGEPKVKKTGTKRKNTVEMDAAGNIVGGEPKVTKKQSVKKEAAAQVMKI